VVRRAADAASIGWKAAVYQEIQQQVYREAVMSSAPMCTLAKVSRAGFYRFRSTPEAGDAEIDLREAMQRIALEFPC
jgi:putative transposase